jgi:hypothetical protein
MTRRVVGWIGPPNSEEPRALVEVVDLGAAEGLGQLGALAELNTASHAAETALGSGDDDGSSTLTLRHPIPHPTGAQYNSRGPMRDADPGPATGVAGLMQDVRTGSLGVFDLAADLYARESARELGRVDIDVGDP